MTKHVRINKTHKVKECTNAGQRIYWVLITVIGKYWSPISHMGKGHILAFKYKSNPSRSECHVLILNTSWYNILTQYNHYHRSSFKTTKTYLETTKHVYSYGNDCIRVQCKLTNRTTTINEHDTFAIPLRKVVI